MPSNTECVTAFRKVVDLTVLQYDWQTSGSWLREAGIANFGPVTFISSDRDTMPVLGARHGHYWAVMQEGLLIDRSLGYAGKLAIVATQEDHETLLRRWSTPSPAGGELTSERVLSDPIDLEAATIWAKSPHIEGGLLATLGVLTHDERDQLREAYSEAADHGRSVRYEVARLNADRITY
jgi:hypothetical protein